MEKFNVRCPDHYPMRCNLSPADKDYLLSSEKYKAFFILQYGDQDEWLSSTIERYFSERTWRLFNAGKESGTGTKFCNICRYALASDFGIVSLSPLNYNVYQEIGLMQGLQKQLLYILNPDRINRDDLPFDTDDQIYIEHRNEKELDAGLDKKIPLIIDKVQLLTGFESGKKEHLRNKLNQLEEDDKIILKLLLFEGDTEYFYEPGRRPDQLTLFISKHLPLPEPDIQNCLRRIEGQKFIIYRAEERKVPKERVLEYKKLNDNYRKDLEELLWEK